MDFIHEIEEQLGVKADKKMLELQPGDVPKTWANVDDFHAYTNFKPRVGIKEGICNAMDWYTHYSSKEAQLTLP
jgi:UDP-glucuronate 4-epimerase